MICEAENAKRLAIVYTAANLRKCKRVRRGGRRALSPKAPCFDRVGCDRVGATADTSLRLACSTGPCGGQSGEGRRSPPSAAHKDRSSTDVNSSRRRQCRVRGLRRPTLSAGAARAKRHARLPEPERTRPPARLCSTARVRVTGLPPHARTTATLIALGARPQPRRSPPCCAPGPSLPHCCASRCLPVRRSAAAPGAAKGCACDRRPGCRPTVTSCTATAPGSR